jgi:hypothetical protein
MGPASTATALNPAGTSGVVLMPDLIQPWPPLAFLNESSDESFIAQG